MKKPLPHPTGQRTMTEQKTYNVTNLTPKQRRALFAECINQAGFCAFIKNQNKKQTHYTFQYN